MSADIISPDHHGMKPLHPRRALPCLDKPIKGTPARRWTISTIGRLSRVKVDSTSSRMPLLDSSSDAPVRLLSRSPICL